LIHFLLPGQKKISNRESDNNDTHQNHASQHREGKTETATTDETIDDIFGSCSAKKTKSKDKFESKRKTDDNNLESPEEIKAREYIQDCKQQYSEKKISDDKSNLISNSKHEEETNKINGMIQTEEGSDKITLVRSVQDAVNDKVGRRPRANSTDRELNLPQHGLCDERFVQLSHKWDLNRLYNCNGSPQIVPPPRGLVNLGNTCFLNSTLQCLVYMPSFCQSIISLPSSCYESNNGETQRHGQRITMMLRSFLRVAHGIAQRERNEPFRTKPFAPKNIFKAITSCKINGHRFRAGRQEDAHELLGK
jgi:hypothetical protein